MTSNKRVVNPDNLGTPQIIVEIWTTKVTNESLVNIVQFIPSSGSGSLCGDKIEGRGCKTNETQEITPDLSTNRIENSYEGS